jgi:hydroxymethylpyrimidine/phosphomethylpyrimidine kinase
VKKVLTIAGSDCSGGAGIQADLKTITAHQMYGMSVITALTAQNTTGVYGVAEIDAAFVARQLDCVFGDIFPDAVKIGMVSSVRLIEVIAEKLTRYQAKNIVIDPVMFSTSGHALMSVGAMRTLIASLLPLGDAVTPNLAEAQSLCGREIKDEADMVRAAEIIGKPLKGGVLIKGGHLDGGANDLLDHNGETVWFKGAKIDNPNTHGTGCTLSSAIACRLAEGFDLPESVRRAKAYVTGALRAGLNLGQGRGPLNHCWNLTDKTLGTNPRV